MELIHFPKKKLSQSSYKTQLMSAVESSSWTTLHYLEETMCVHEMLVHVSSVFFRKELLFKSLDKNNLIQEALRSVHFL